MDIPATATTFNTRSQLVVAAMVNKGYRHDSMHWDTRSPLSFRPPEDIMELLRLNNEGYDCNI